MGAHTNGQAAETRVILDAVRRIVRTLHQSSRMAEKTVGLTGAQLFVLQKLAESPGLSLNDLAARTHTHQSSVSTVVGRLVDAGLVHRAPSPADARRLQLRLSAAGRRVLGRAPAAAQNQLIDTIEQLPAVQRRNLARALLNLTNAMHLAGGDAPMFFQDETRRGKGGRSRA